MLTAWSLGFLTDTVSAQVLIISYETFRLHAERLSVPGSCDLLLCDEAHRLKNDATLTNRASGGGRRLCPSRTNIP